VIPAPSSPTNFSIPMFNFIIATPTPSYHAAQHHDDQRCGDSDHEAEHEAIDAKPAKMENTEPTHMLSTANNAANFRSHTVPPNHGSVVQRQLSLAAASSNSD
jgi:hypothetical protein